MARTRLSAKRAGATFNALVARYLAKHIDDRIEVRHVAGAHDRGDIAALRVHGERVVVECKDYGGRILASQWIREAQRERDNDHAVSGVVVMKRRGVRAAGDQYVLMTLRDLVYLITGERVT